MRKERATSNIYRLNNTEIMYKRVRTKSSYSKARVKQGARVNVGGGGMVIAAGEHTMSPSASIVNREVDARLYSPMSNGTSLPQFGKKPQSAVGGRRKKGNRGTLGSAKQTIRAFHNEAIAFEGSAGYFQHYNPGSQMATAAPADLEKEIMAMSSPKESSEVSLTRLNRRLMNIEDQIDQTQKAAAE